MKRIISIVALFSLLATSISASNLEYKVHRAGDNAFNVASVLITGEKEAVLIDAHFTKSDAHKVVAQILESKKVLKTIYVSHGDPDFYFGLPVIKEAFPNVEIYASLETVKHIKKTSKKKLDFWGPKLGVNGSNYVVLPKVLKGDTLILEDKKIKIIGLKSKNPKRSFVYVPSLKAIFGGINIFANNHLWMADSASKEKRAAWLKVLNNMSKLDVQTVVPAHAGVKTKLDKSAIEFTKNYLITYEKELMKAKNSKELISAMQKAYPQLGKNSFILSLGAQVSTGEQKW